MTSQNRFSDNQTTLAIRISSSGDNVILTPAAGALIQLHWIGLSTSENNAAEVLAIVKFGAIEHYRWNMGVPGAFSHWQVIRGTTDAPLVVNLSAARNVEVNFTYEEIS